MKPEGTGPKARWARRHWREDAKVFTSELGKKEAQNVRTRGNTSPKRVVKPGTRIQQIPREDWLPTTTEHQPIAVQPLELEDSKDKETLEEGSFSPTP